MMNKMNMKFFFFSDGTASKKKKRKKKVNLPTILRNRFMKLNCSINFHVGLYKMSDRTDRQCRSKLCFFKVLIIVKS